MARSSRNPPPVVINLEGDNTHLANFCGPLDINLRQIGDGWNVQINRRGQRIAITGANAEKAAEAVQWFHSRAVHKELSASDIQLGLVELGAGHDDPTPPANAPDTEQAAGDEHTEVRDARNLPDVPADDTPPNLRTPKAEVRPRTPRQREYLSNILRHDITFGIGPAGTGKTWLAVACAIDALERDLVERLVLTRPAVEAGERLGFLPGDLAQKVDPYLKPLYDALYDLMGFERVQRMFERQVIEIAPLAYMRGRTLNHAFVILDEAQNTTPEQMKMFLTRIGFGSKAVVNGDPSQIDLPRGQRSGLNHAVEILRDVNGIVVTHFTSRDVVRHPLVARIVDAYEQAGNHAS